MHFEDIERALTLLALIFFPLIERWARKRRLAQMEESEQNAATQVQQASNEPLHLPPTSSERPSLSSTINENLLAMSTAKTQVATSRGSVLDLLYDAVTEPLRTFAVTYELAWPSSSQLQKRKLAKSRATDQLSTWPTVAHAAALDFFSGIPGLRQELHGMLSLPYRAQLPKTPKHFDRPTVHSFFGGWLEDIVEDTVATLYLGPVYTASLLAKDPEAVPLAWYTHDGGIDLSKLDHAPLLIRARSSLTVLQVLGLTKEHNELLAQCIEKHGETLVLPSQDGFLEIPFEHLENFLSHIVELSTSNGLQSLSGHALIDIPGFAYFHAEDHESKLAAKAFMHQRQPETHHPRSLWVGAMIAASQKPPAASQIQKQCSQLLLDLSTHYHRDASWDIKLKKPRSQIGAKLPHAFSNKKMLIQSIILGEALKTKTLSR
ncbi:MAG: hypothetical protein IPJ88_08280 [Myxococcales bacterium]|nr:MAG: hypothetical protein IPJ88_08280 [Myxococcales bacterium]